MMILIVLMDQKIIQLYHIQEIKKLHFWILNIKIIILFKIILFIKFNKKQYWVPYYTNSLYQNNLFIFLYQKIIN